MTPRDDRFPDMPPSVQFDAAIEQALRGDAVGDDVATFARFVDDVRVMADRPPPPPSPALAVLLAGSAATREAPSTAVPSPPRTRSLPQARSIQPTSRRWRSARIRLRVAAVPIACKAAVLLAVATSAAAGAAAGILPEPATHFVRRAIEVVTPFELPGDDDRPRRDELRVDNTGVSGVDPGTGATRLAGLPPAAVAADAGFAQDPDVEANTDRQSESNPTDEASSWAETYPERDTSAWPTSPSPPTSSHQSKGPKKAAASDAGSPTEPGPKTGHVPPGYATPGTPRPGGPPSSGDAQLFDPDPVTDRSARPAGKGRPAPPMELSSNPARQRPHHGPPPGAGPGPASNEEGPPNAPPPNAGHGPSAGVGRDHGQCGQSGAALSRPADCAAGAPHDPGLGPRGDTGPAQAVDAPEPEPPTP
jgi:hypothetical protein